MFVVCKKPGVRIECCLHMRGRQNLLIFGNRLTVMGSNIVEQIDKVSNFSLAAIMIACCFFLFAPESYLSTIKVDSFVNSYGGLIGGALVASVIIIVIRITLYIFVQLKRLIAFIEKLDRIKEKMKSLSVHERNMLIQIYQSEDLSTPWPTTDLLVTGLYEIVEPIRSTDLLKAFELGPLSKNYMDYTFTKYGLKYLPEDIKRCKNA
ncbi:MAG TPA: super-infection exclusion protein B [Arachidicoccus soli]|nr:super-infection exclusion protein B [Arachidicoccus soli]